MTIALVLVLWAESVLASVAVGRRKHRMGFVYGLLLSWAGVLLLALLPPRPAHEEVLGTKWDETYAPTNDSFFRNQQYYSKH